MDEALEHSARRSCRRTLTRTNWRQHLPAFDGKFDPYSIEHEALGRRSCTGPPPPETPPMETQDEAEIKLEDEGGEAGGGGDGRALRQMRGRMKSRRVEPSED